MSAEITTCISCGMPMRSAAEHAQQDPTKSYCKFCARPDGAMRSYDEALVGMAQFLKKTQGLDDAVARTSAREMMAKLPAWSGTAKASRSKG